MIVDDGRGVGEALDETVCVGDTCEGLTVLYFRMVEVYVLYSSTLLPIYVHYFYLLNNILRYVDGTDFILYTYFSVKTGN